jgi:hypothetical protein
MEAQNPLAGRCNSPLRGKPGKLCRRYPIAGHARCKLHGGKSLAGIASPTYTNGRYSKVMPTQLMSLYKQAEADPNRLSIEQDLALQDALLMSALEGMSRGEAGEVWAELKAAWQEYHKAKRDPKQDEDEVLRRIGFLIEEGYSEQRTRREVRQMLQERAKLVDAEGKRIERAQQSLSVNQVMVLASALLNAVTKNVTDPHALRAIKTDFGRLLNTPAPASTRDD